MSHIRKDSATGLAYAYLAPALLAIGIILLYPIGRAIYLSFCHYDLMSGMQKPVLKGFRNYLALFRDAAFWRSVYLTLVYTAGMTAGSFLSGLITALILNAKFAGRKLARTIAAMPWAISPAVACLIWVWMFDHEFGVVNYLLTQTGILSHKIQWLSQGTTAMIAVIVVSIWKFFPIAMVSFLAALQTVPPELYESAKIDGAGFFHRLFSVTLPSIKPVSAIMLNLLVLWSFRRFTKIYIMTGGGPAGATETLIIQTYQEAFRYWDMGKASAIGTFTLFIAMLFSVAYLLLIFRADEKVL